MTETKKKALALLNEVAKEMGLEKVSSLELDMPGERALLRALEQHEAFKREVSDVISELSSEYESMGSYYADKLRRFIIAKPDYVQDALEEVFAGDSLHIDCAKELRAALAARGLEIREVGHD